MSQQPQPSHPPNRPSAIGDVLSSRNKPRRSNAPLAQSLATSGHPAAPPLGHQTAHSTPLRPLALSLPRTGYARELPADDRALCPSCHGTGAYGTRDDIMACAGCAANRTTTFAGEERGYCASHQCRTCIGAGVVCPHCCGMRFVRMSRPAGNEVSRCPTCCEGNNVNETLEMFAIRAWLARRCPACSAVRPRGEATCQSCGVITPTERAQSRIWESEDTP